MRQRRAAAEPGNSYQYVLLAALRVLVALYREAQPRCFQAEAHKNVPDTEAVQIRHQMLL